MTTTTTTAVPRSRLNITYRTRIDGRVVPKELPLRLLVAGDFSGRAKSLAGPGQAIRPLPMLDKRLMYSIVGGTTLEGALGRARIGLPLPTTLALTRSFALRGQATVRVERTVGQTGEPEYLLSLLGTTISSAVELSAKGSEPAADSKAYEGELRSVSQFKIVGQGQPAGDEQASTTQSGAPAGASGALVAWTRASAQRAKRLSGTHTWVGDAKELGGWLEVADPPTGEPPNMFEIAATLEQKSGTPGGPGAIPQIAFHFEQELETAFTGKDREAVELRVEITCERVTGKRSIPVSDMSAFTPERVAYAVPEIRRQLVVRWLLSQARSMISSNPVLRNTCKEMLFDAPEGLVNLRKQVAPLQKKLFLAKPSEAEDASVDQDPAEATPSSAEDAKELAALCRAAGFGWVDVETKCAMIQVAQSGGLHFHEHEPGMDQALFVNAVAAVVFNLELPEGDRNIPGFMLRLDNLVSDLDGRIESNIMTVIRQPRFREIERNFRMLSQMVDAIEGDNVQIDVLDVTKEELAEDIRDNANHMMGSALFQRMYVGEYDRFGGIPFSSIVTLFEYDPSDSGPSGDLQFLKGLGRLAAHCHAPVVGAVAPMFFGLGSYDQLADLDQLERVLERPKYGKWAEFRDSHEAAYVGLTLPRYLLRTPFRSREGARLQFDEVVHKTSDYLWGNSAALFAQNMIRSFELSKWCQHVRGPEGGGLVRGLPVHVLEGSDGVREEQPPVDAAIPDFRELQLANAGFIALVSRKDQLDEACFFSARSAKLAKDFVDELDTQNAHLVTNLSYTLSVSRVAHYIKRMARDYVGSTADGPYLQSTLEAWLSEYVTTVTNPDDLTLTRYPFKAVSVQVEPSVGALGWYKCTTSILPHVQFEGMDVELRLEAALGG